MPPNQAFCHDLFARLRGGSHLILYGPRGAGKSTLINDLLGQYREIDTPCGVAPRWRDGRLHLAVPCTDTEIAIRSSRSGPCILRRRGEL